MKLIRFGNLGEEKPGLLLPDGVRVDASDSGSDYDEAFFASGGLARLEQWFKKDGANAPRVPSSALGRSHLPA